MGGWNVHLFHWEPSPAPCPGPCAQGSHCCIWLWKFSMREPLFPMTGSKINKQIGPAGNDMLVNRLVCCHR
jgi:hypothetical protein